MNKDKRLEDTDQKIWSAILECCENHKEKLPFSASDLVRASQIENDSAKENGSTMMSVSTISRNRGGVDKFVSSYHVKMLAEIEERVQDNLGKGPINYKRFFSKLAYNLADYKYLLELEITLQRKIGLVEEIVNIIQPVLPENSVRESLVALFFLTLDIWAKTGFVRSDFYKVRDCLAYAVEASGHRGVSFIDLFSTWRRAKWMN